jgi:hypothetical protein
MENLRGDLSKVAHLEVAHLEVAHLEFGKIQ